MTKCNEVCKYVLYLNVVYSIALCIIYAKLWEVFLNFSLLQRDMTVMPKCRSGLSVFQFNTVQCNTGFHAFTSFQFQSFGGWCFHNADIAFDIQHLEPTTVWGGLCMYTPKNFQKKHLWGGDIGKWSTISVHEYIKNRASLNIGISNLGISKYLYIYMSRRDTEWDVEILSGGSVRGWAAEATKIELD